jgi:hypothetical protein
VPALFGGDWFIDRMGGETGKRSYQEAGDRRYRSDPARRHDDRRCRRGGGRRTERLPHRHSLVKARRQATRAQRRAGMLVKEATPDKLVPAITENGGHSIQNPPL